MSSDEEAAAAAVDMLCACCGVAAIDDVKLKDCDDGCNLVKYCSNECQELHRPENAGECKKRLAEIRDKDLFEQPDESYLGECPICCLPLPIDHKKYSLMSCCSQKICIGCNFANKKREFEAGLEQRCAFCREPVLKSKEEHNKRCMKRIKKNDPAALCTIGKECCEKGDYKTALEYFTKAAKLGDTRAYYELSCMYYNGRGVEKNTKMYTYYSEQAAIAGHHLARHNLGCIEASVGRHERAKKHFIIAANLGYQGSLNNLKRLYADGHATKEDYADALRAYQAALGETKSAEREKAEEAIKNGLW